MGVDDVVQPSLRHAAARTKSRIPIDRAAVADPPWNYEDRRQPLDLHLDKLAVWVPERHDLLPMKAVRAARHDVQVLLRLGGAERRTRLRRKRCVLAVRS